MATYKNSRLQQVEANSQDSSTGAISTTEVEGGEQDISVEVSDSVQDTEQQTVFTVSRLPGSIAIFDYDFCFTDTLNSSNTLEEEMVQRNFIYVRLTLQDGTMQLPDGSTWIEVRPVVYPELDAGTDDDLVVGRLDFQHSEYNGVQRPV
jgi:hypothetical protein